MMKINEVLDVIRSQLPPEYRVSAKWRQQEDSVEFSIATDDGLFACATQISPTHSRGEIEKQTHAALEILKSMVQ